MADKADKGKPNGTKVSNKERSGSEAKEVRRRSLVMEDLGAGIPNSRSPLFNVQWEFVFGSQRLKRRHENMNAIESKVYIIEMIKDSGE